MNQGKVLSIVALGLVFSSGAFATAFSNLGKIELNSVSRSEWVQSEARGRDAVDGTVQLNEALTDKAKRAADDEAKKEAVQLKLSLDDLQTYHEAAKKLVDAVKAGKGKDETDEVYKKRLEGLSAEVGKAAAPVVKAIVKQTGDFGSDIVYARGTDDKLILIFVKVEKDEEGNVKPKILGSLGIQLEIKDGKVTGFGPLKPPKKD